MVEPTKMKITDIPYQPKEKLSQACADFFEDLLRQSYDEEDPCYSVPIKCSQITQADDGQTKPCTNPSSNSTSKDNNDSSETSSVNSAKPDELIIMHVENRQDSSSLKQYEYKNAIDISHDENSANEINIESKNGNSTNIKTSDNTNNVLEEINHQSQDNRQNRTIGLQENKSNQLFSSSNNSYLGRKNDFLKEISNFLGSDSSELSKCKDKQPENNFTKSDDKNNEVLPIEDIEPINEEPFAGSIKSNKEKTEMPNEGEVILLSSTVTPEELYYLKEENGEDSEINKITSYDPEKNPADNIDNPLGLPEETTEPEIRRETHQSRTNGQIFGTNTVCLTNNNHVTINSNTNGIEKTENKLIFERNSSTEPQDFNSEIDLEPKLSNRKKSNHGDRVNNFLDNSEEIQVKTARNFYYPENEELQPPQVNQTQNISYRPILDKIGEYYRNLTHNENQLDQNEPDLEVIPILTLRPSRNSLVSQIPSDFRSVLNYLNGQGDNQTIEHFGQSFVINDPDPPENLVINVNLSRMAKFLAFMVTLNTAILIKFILWDQILKLLI